MLFFTTSLMAAMLAMAPIANAHIVINTPVPFGKPNNSPLAENGADFPCKQVKGAPYVVNTQNKWAVGSTQDIKFTGSAVHSGGSCQISVSANKEPTPDSKWKVIYSIEGGCPPPPPALGNFEPGNAEKDGGGFQFTVPSELPNGDLAMAWTWANRGGNREFYMNCAPITVTGGSDDKAAFEALPDMAVANILSRGTCKTTETFDYTYENPGKYKIQNGKGPFMPLCGGALTPGAPANPGAPSQSPPANPGIPSPAPPAASAPAANAGVPTPSQAATSNGQLTSTIRKVITVTAPSAAGPTPEQGVASATKSSREGAPAPAASSAPAESAPGGAAPPAGSACSPDGSVVCSPDGKQFALCNFGKAVFQPVAQGTSCQGGKIAKRADFASTLRIVYA